MSQVRCESLEATVTGEPWAGQAVSDGSSARISNFKLDSQGESDWASVTPAITVNLKAGSKKLSQGITC